MLQQLARSKNLNPQSKFSSKYRLLMEQKDHNATIIIRHGKALSVGDRMEVTTYLFAHISGCF